MSASNDRCSSGSKARTTGLLELSLLCVARFLEHTALLIADRQTQNRAVRLLHSFSDRQLKDLGIRREEIEQAVREGRRSQEDDKPASW